MVLAYLLRIRVYKLSVGAFNHRAEETQKYIQLKINTFCCVLCHLILGTKTYANYNRDLVNASSYVTGSRDFALAVHNDFSTRYRKRKLFLPPKNSLY